jgi:hypothetical protein
VLGDADDPLEKQLAVAQLSHGRLSRLVAQVEPYFPVAQERTLQIAVATARVLLRRQANTLRVDLERLRAATAARREQPNPAVAEAVAVAERLAERLGRRVFLPKITWPAKSGPFDPPVLQEAEG